MPTILQHANGPIEEWVVGVADAKSGSAVGSV